MLICRVQCNWLQKAGSAISKPVLEYYNFFHFPTPVEIRIGDEVIRTRPNACIFSAPKAPRWFYFEQDTTMNWIHAYKDIAVLLEKYDIPLNQVFYPSNSGFISDVFRKMVVEKYGSDSLCDDMLDTYAVEFLIRLSRSIHRGNAPEICSAELKKMHHLRWRVLSEPQRRWTVADMAELVSLSPSRFHAVYRAVFSVSPMKDVVNAKIDYAKSLLLMDNNPTIAEVAEHMGYKNQQHFISQFKAVTGKTPGQYRKSNR